MFDTTLDYDFDADLDGEMFTLDPEMAAFVASLFSGSVPHDEYPAGNRVFDWKKAARRIKETGAKNASAGLAEDWSFTGGDILINGEVVAEEDTYTFLESYWATPVLILDGVEEECWTLSADSDYDAATYWPSNALRVLAG